MAARGDSRRRARSGIALWAVVACAVALLTPAVASASLYKSPSQITIPAMGAATPYPASIAVSGLPGEVSKVRVTLGNYAHGNASDTDVLLVTPSGQRTLVMSDACGSTPIGGETLIFDEAAPAPLPNSSCLGFNNQVFKPTNYFIADVFAAPAPPGPYVVTFSVLTGAQPNGSWQLFVHDEGGASSGSFITGWNLELLTSATCSGKPVATSAAEGTAAGDVITGTSGNDVLVSLGGADTVRGLGGNDIICGGDANDKLIGGPGKDLLLGEGGKDKLTGSGGKDVCKGGAKKDTAASCEKKKTI